MEVDGKLGQDAMQNGMQPSIPEMHPHRAAVVGAWGHWGIAQIAGPPPYLSGFNSLTPLGLGGPGQPEI